MRLVLKVFASALLLIPALTNANEKAFRWEASIDLQSRAPLAQKIPSNFYPALGGSIALPQAAQGKPFLIAVRDPDCPVSRRYSPHLHKLESGNLNVIYLLSGKLATEAVAQRDKQRHQLISPYLLDADRTLSEWLGVRTSSEVYLFDGQGRLRYRGAIDDRFGIGFSRPQARQHFLNDALNAMRAGLAVKIPATSAPGCYVHNPIEKNVSANVSWHQQVSRLMTDKCQLCHRPEQAAPFPLQTYEQVVQRKDMIRFVLEKKIMPPWFAAGSPDRWFGNRHLATADRQLMIDWIDAGAPEGDPANAAKAREWKNGWQFGEPDVVLTSPRVLNIPAEGEIAYEYISIPTKFAEDRWVQTLEVVTEAPQNTHHIILFLLPPESMQKQLMPGTSAKTDLSIREKHLLTLRGFYGGYVQGLPGVRYQEGSAKLLPKGWRILMQIHHEANGRPTQDRPKIGIQFAKQRPDKVIQTLAASTKDLTIPAGEPRYLKTAEYSFAKNGQILGFFPHTHLRGTAFRYELLQANGTAELLLDVPRYDPNWQLHYQLNIPIDVAAGATLVASAWYDNSESNPNNPDPSVDVNFGLRTRDEMMIGYFDWVENTVSRRALMPQANNC